ncbi:hypothetical protein [Streptomyces sp. NPDC057257]|uniref:hypothetical protein n=1 Tax=Streptomyces sp. NPDC057257 TaxID=3346071 RepID=UPI003635EFC5
MGEHPDQWRKAPPQAYQTFRINSPTDRFIVAACEQVGCQWWREGWDSIVDERTADGKLQAWTIRYKSRRTFRELRTADGRTVFRFAPGQRCFQEHRTRPELYVVRGGDSRGNPRGERRVHARPADWVEHMREHLDGLRDEQAKG